MSAKPVFGTFDRSVDVDIHVRDLPHWFQPGTAIFITFRTIDSLPKEIIAQWHREIRDWLAKCGVDSASFETDRPSPAQIPLELRAEYRRVCDQGWQTRLDQCHGECVLRSPGLSHQVSRVLHHFDGVRYDLGSFVVMPNHVHAIVQFRRGFDLKNQVTSWMRYSANRINQAIGRRGAFWQSEPFDHLIRSERQFIYLQNYIANNPRKANLKPKEYQHYQA